MRFKIRRPSSFSKNEPRQINQVRIYRNRRRPSRNVRPTTRLRRGPRSATMRSLRLIRQACSHRRRSPNRILSSRRARHSRLLRRRYRSSAASTNAYFSSLARTNKALRRSTLTKHSVRRGASAIRIRTATTIAILCSTSRIITTSSTTTIIRRKRRYCAKSSSKSVPGRRSAESSRCRATTISSCSTASMATSTRRRWRGNKRLVRLTIRTSI